MFVCRYQDNFPTTICTCHGAETQTKPHPPNLSAFTQVMDSTTASLYQTGVDRQLGTCPVVVNIAVGLVGSRFVWLIFLKRLDSNVCAVIVQVSVQMLSTSVMKCDARK